MNQFDAIFARKSVKSFKSDSVSDRSISQILNFANYIKDTEGKNSVNFEVWSWNEKKGVSEHRFLVKAPYYLVISASCVQDCFMNLGFVYEQIALYLTTKNLGSCFAGLKKEKKPGSEQDKVIVFLGFGISFHGSAYLKRQRMLPLEHVCIFKDKADPNIRDMISAAVLAPSRSNSQPWRFLVVKNRIHVFCKKDRLSFKSSAVEWYHEFAIGMMLANFLIASEELWYNTEIVKSENIAEKQLKNNSYMCTIVVTEQQSDFEWKKEPSQQEETEL
ncbi:nitroreductase family protein [[Clostridium] polysaccharolyticum]|uniref:Putative TM nitroreductase n=1 Tax=[Clostridium] polysaccharolyticum TaxID=29364 RepID=A0A1I0FQ15_9FIRM|nr:nitroreductase family protein [[Clostridium] polysaccharolyticum]SET60539.1 Putative TM nitroreductase [[Clostridium] polysaccharolyticum]